jgi:hypothetical protein
VFCIALVAALFGGPIWAEASAKRSIVVLDFGLYDLTLLPRVSEELRRVASIASTVRRHLSEKGGYKLVNVPAEGEVMAGVNSGYFFDHPSEAADIGRQAGVQWIAIGRLAKSSFLFAYLRIQIVNVTTSYAVDDFIVEIKGPVGSDRLIERGAQHVADRIDEAIRAASTAADKETQATASTTSKL